VSRAASDWEEIDPGFADNPAVGQAIGRDAVRAVPRREPGPHAAPRPRRVVRWGQLAVVVLVGYLGVMGTSSEVSYLRVEHQASGLAAQAASLASANRSLARQIVLLHQTRYVDELARTEMGYTSPGEEELVPKPEKSTASAG